MAIHIGRNTSKWRPPGEKRQAEGKLQHYRATEDKLIENIEYKDKVLALAEELIPLLEGDAKAMDIEKMLSRMAPVAVMRLMDVVVNGNHKDSKAAAKDLLHMAGYKPVEKSISVTDNASKFTEEQLNSFLGNAFRGMDKSEKDTIMKLIEGPDGTYEVEQEEL